MVLTEEQQTDPYPAATMETAQAANEGNYYANLNTGVAKPAGYPSNTSTNITSPNDRVAKVNGNGNKIGPSIILKVMAGDKFNVRVSSWYKTNGVQPAAPQNPLQNLLAALSASAGSVTANGVHGASTTTEIVNSNVLTPGATQFLSSRSYTSTKPKAYLNWILLDEHFNVAKDDAGNIIASGYSGAEQVPDESFYGTAPNNTVKWHTQNDLPINKSGYLYVYVSNETPNIDVFFDNLQVTHTRGAILEETHYYPFGLTMAGISSKAAGSLENKKKWNAGSELQNQEFSDGSGLELYATFYRSLDPQVGRFLQIDPKVEGQEKESPYSAMANNPVLKNDPLGDEPNDPPTKGIWKGFTDGLGGYFSNIGHAISHPVETVKGAVNNVIEHPVDFVLNKGSMGLYGKAKQIYNDTKENGFGYAVGHMAGNNVGEVVTAVGTAGVIKGVGSGITRLTTKTLFRAVSQAELADAAANGVRVQPGGGIL